MTLPILILRPQPAADVTAARVAEWGGEPVIYPLFAVAPLAWEAPDAARFDWLLLTSANALRHGGAALQRYAGLPCACVGSATAAAARAAGLRVMAVGESDGDTLLTTLPSTAHVLWLCGAEHSQLAVPVGTSLTPCPVYMAAATDIVPENLPAAAVAMLHSSRAAQRLQAVIPDKTAISLVAISAKVAQAAGDGWRQIAIAPQPDDAQMVAIAVKLCHERNLSGQ